jgi:hypothetical protein
VKIKDNLPKYPRPIDTVDSSEFQSLVRVGIPKQNLDYILLILAFTSKMSLSCLLDSHQMCPQRLDYGHFGLVQQSFELLGWG